MKLLILDMEALRGSSNLRLPRKYYNFTALFHFGDSWHALTEEPRHGSLRLMGLVSGFFEAILCNLISDSGKVIEHQWPSPDKSHNGGKLA